MHIYLSSKSYILNSFDAIQNFMLWNKYFSFSGIPSVTPTPALVTTITAELLSNGKYITLQRLLYTTQVHPGAPTTGSGTTATSTATITESSKGVFLLWDYFYESSLHAYPGTSTIATTTSVRTVDSSSYG